MIANRSGLGRSGRLIQAGSAVDMAMEPDGPAAPLDRETQAFHGWVLLVLAGFAGLMWYIAATLPKPANILFLFVATGQTLFAIVLAA